MGTRGEGVGLAGRIGQIHKEGPGGGKARARGCGCAKQQAHKMKVARLAGRQVASPLPCQHFLMSPWLGCVGGVGQRSWGSPFPGPWRYSFGGVRRGELPAKGGRPLSVPLLPPPETSLWLVWLEEAGSEAAGEKGKQSARVWGHAGRFLSTDVFEPE